MKFKDFEYRRPNFGEFTQTFEASLTAFQNAQTLAIQSTALETIQALRKSFDSMYNICHIRYTMNTADVFYEAEEAYFNHILPHYQALKSRFYALLVASKWRSQLEERWGQQLFTLAELHIKSFSSEVLQESQTENQIRSQYTKLLASAQINLGDATYNLAELLPLETSTDRVVRKQAASAKWQFFETHANQFDQIFDNLVQIRHRIAQKLGFRNFIELGYLRLSRADYNADMVAHVRQQILEHVVPLTQQLYQKQAKRLNIDTLTCYDEPFKFLSGNPRPQGDAQWIVQNAQKMYENLSAETHEFFQTMTEQELMDLQTRPSKAVGGYCTFISQYQTPFIFSNFNGTSHDIDVLTHEAGHAFQVFSSRHQQVLEYYWPTLEACEIHSMSMELFTFPAMENFFGADTAKYQFMHLANALQFLPYGVAVDEFQHVIYENPTLTPSERHAAWQTIEQKYLPHRNYENFPFLAKGGFWQRQQHIFLSPFYYIDYVLAQICAFQFWTKSQTDASSAWADYLHLCQQGGSKPFLELVELANLESPFKAGVVQKSVQNVWAFLSKIDDSSF